MSGTLDLYQALFEPFDDNLKETKRQGGQTITFVGWPAYIDRAHKTFEQGFSYEIRSVTTIGSLYKAHDDDGEEIEVDDRQIVVVARVTDKQSGCYQEATGAAPVAKTKQVWGGALPEAESQALRRAFAKWGLGLEMYLDDDTFNTFADWHDADEPEEDEDPEDEEDEEEEDDVVPMTEDQVRRMQNLVAVLEDNELGHIADAAREKIADAKDQKKVAGLVIRKTKDYLEKEGIEWDEDEDPS